MILECTTARRGKAPWHAVIDRHAFYAAATCAIASAVEQCESGLARRRAEGEAILRTLELLLCYHTNPRRRAHYPLNRGR
jgi:hypothetical protein